MGHVSELPAISAKTRVSTSLGPNSNLGRGGRGSHAGVETFRVATRKYRTSRQGAKRSTCILFHFVLRRKVKKGNDATEKFKSYKQKDMFSI